MAFRWNHRPYSASSRRVAPAVSPNASSSRTQTPQYFVVHSATGKATLQQRPTSANAASRQKSSQQTNASFRGFAGRATPTTRTGTSSKQSAPDVAKHRSSLAATTVESTLDSIPTPHSSLPSEEDDREKRRQVERKSRSAERVSSENTAGYGNAYPLRSHSGNYGQRPQSAKMSSSRNQYTSQRERQHLQASAESTSGSSGQHQPKAHAPSSSSGGVDAAASGQPRNVHAQYTKAVGIPQRPQSASAASSKHAAVPPPYSRPTVSQSNQRPAWHAYRATPETNSTSPAPSAAAPSQRQPSSGPTSTQQELARPAAASAPTAPQAAATTVTPAAVAAAAAVQAKNARTEQRSNEATSSAKVDPPKPAAANSKNEAADAAKKEETAEAPNEREHLEKLLVSAKPRDRSSTDFYSFGKVVGTGSFAKVRVARHKLTGQLVAIKTYEKAKIKDANQLKRISSEIKVMEALDHPLVSRFFETIESARRVHLVMEFLGEGNLCSYIKEKRKLGEEEARGIFSQLCQGVEYMHKNDYIHRDIKLENVLFDESRHAKLIDFGFSVQCKEPKRLKVFCGTPSYMAPEIVNRVEYRGKPVDMWSLGVVLFAMLSGCFPFSAKTYPDLYKKILRGTFQFPTEFNTSLRDLLTGLLTADPTKRFTVSQARNHPWTLKHTCQVLKHTPTAQHTVSKDPRHDLYREAVGRMCALGVKKEELVGDVVSRKRNSLTTCYYLLAVAMRLRQKPGGTIT